DPTFTASSDGAVYALLVQTDGRIVVGGSFSTLSGVARANLGRLNPDGSLDSTLPGNSVLVLALALQDDGKIVAASDVAVRRFNPDGTADGAFNVAVVTPLGYPYSVYCLTMQPDGKILIGGNFTSLGGVSRSGLGRINPNGTVDTFNPAPNGTVYCLLP